MELEREHSDTDNFAANSSTAPAPVSPLPQAAAQSSTSLTVELHLSEPWHKIWNPLKLSATATSEFNATFGKWCCCLKSNVVFSLYLFVVYLKHLLFPAVPMLIFLGDPLKEQEGEGQALSIIFYCIFGYLLIFPIALASMDYYFMNRFRRQASYFKVVLFAERRKEDEMVKKSFICLNLIVVFFVGLFRILNARKFESCLEIQKHGSQSDITSKETREQICGTPTNYSSVTCNCFLPPPDSPSPSSINFWLLVFSYLFFVLKVATYNDCFADHMLPDTRFVKKYYPDEFKIANQLIPEGWADGDYGDFFLEPNIPIRPVYFCCTWFFTDSRETLKDIMLVCDRVVVLWQVHYSQLTPEVLPTQKIRDFRSSKIAATDKKLLDDSLKWEYVLSHCPIFPIILNFSIGTFKT